MCEGCVVLVQKLMKPLPAKQRRAVAFRLFPRTLILTSMRSYGIATPRPVSSGRRYHTDARHV